MTLVATFVTYGAASWAGGAAGTAVGGGTAGAVVGGAMTAGVSALAGQVAVATLNNRGDLGETREDLRSNASVKGLVTSILTAGAPGGLNLNPTGQAGRHRKGSCKPMTTPNCSLATATEQPMAKPLRQP